MRGEQHVLYSLKTCTAYLGESEERKKNIQHRRFKSYRTNISGQ